MDGCPAGGPADRATSEAGERCEVALTCFPADDGHERAALRVQFDKHAPQIIAAVTGRHSGILRARASSAYGGEKQPRDPPVDPGPKGLTGSRLSFDVFEGRRLGPFRIEAWVEREGRRISPVSELVLVRIRRPRYCHKDAPEPAFGVHVGSPGARHPAGQGRRRQLGPAVWERRPQRAVGLLRARN